MRQQSQPRSATSAAIAGSPRRAVTSLTIVAPASSAAAATAAFDVSIDSRAPAPASPSSTGTTRRSSSASVTGSAPGRVDSPPTSRIAAPCCDELAPVRDRRRRVEPLAAVGERVRRDVDDPHDDRLGRPSRAAHHAARGRRRATARACAARPRGPRGRRRGRGAAACAERRGRAQSAGAAGGGSCAGSATSSGKTSSSGWPSMSASNSSFSIVSRRTRISETVFSVSRCSVRMSLARWCADSTIAADLVVDLAGDLVGVVGLGGELAAEERLRVVVAEDARAEALAHAVAHDHRLRRRRDLLDVVRRAGRDLAEDDLLGGAAAERHRHRVGELRARREEAVLRRHRDRVAERLAAADDGDLVHRVGVLEVVADDRVAHLVVRGDPALLLAHDPGLLLRAGDDAHDPLFELVLADLALARAGGRAARPR